MTNTETSRSSHFAWDYFKRTGVIIPGYQDVIAERLTESSEKEDKREKVLA